MSSRACILNYAIALVVPLLILAILPAVATASASISSNKTLGKVVAKYGNITILFYNSHEELLEDMLGVKLKPRIILQHAGYKIYVYSVGNITRVGNTFYSPFALREYLSEIKFCSLRLNLSDTTVNTTLYSNIDRRRLANMSRMLADIMRANKLGWTVCRNRGLMIVRTENITKAISVLKLLINNGILQTLHPELRTIAIYKPRYPEDEIWMAVNGTILHKVNDALRRYGMSLMPVRLAGTNRTLFFFGVQKDYITGRLLFIINTSRYFKITRGSLEEARRAAVWVAEKLAEALRAAGFPLEEFEVTFAYVPGKLVVHRLIKRVNFTEDEVKKIREMYENITTKIEEALKHGNGTDAGQSLVELYSERATRTITMNSSDVEDGVGIAVGADEAAEATPKLVRDSEDTAAGVRAVSDGRSILLPSFLAISIIIAVSLVLMSKLRGKK